MTDGNAGERGSTALLQQAVGHHMEGRLAEALSLYDLAIKSDSEIPHTERAEAHFFRALALKQMKRLAEAIDSYDRALALNPAFVEALCNKGNALRELGRPEEALGSYDAAIGLDPGFALAHLNRGGALHDLQRWEEAIQCYQRAIALEPDLAEANDHLALAYNEKGNALRELQHWNEALSCYERAIAVKRDFAIAHINCANVLRVLGRLDEAVASCDRAIAHGRDLANNADTHVWRGNVLKDLARVREALESYQHAIALNPGCADAYWNSGYCALMMGDFAKGWPLYEWRRKIHGAQHYPVHSQPEWTGAEDLGGKTLLVYAEQGLGDTIQFCRYALLARERGARVFRQGRRNDWSDVFAAIEAALNSGSGAGQ